MCLLSLRLWMFGWSWINARRIGLDIGKSILRIRQAIFRRLHVFVWYHCEEQLYQMRIQIWLFSLFDIYLTLIGDYYAYLSLFEFYLTLIWHLFVIIGDYLFLIIARKLFFCYLMIIWWLFDNYSRIINSRVPDIDQVLGSSDNYYIIRYYSEIIFIIHRK